MGPLDCTCETVDATGFDDVARRLVKFSDPNCPQHGSDRSQAPGPSHVKGRAVTVAVTDDVAEATTGADGRDRISPVSEPSWGCCDNPKPRIAEQSNRLFCGSCLRYLDRGRNDQASGTTPNDADEGTVGEEPEAGEDS